MSSPNHTRWVWDLFPLAKRAWADQEIDDAEALPGHTIKLHRACGRDGTIDLGTTNSRIPGTLPLSRRGYVPTEDDLALLARCYPADDPHRPTWHRMKADLVIAGHNPDTLDKSEAPLLLAMLARARSPGRQHAAKKKPPFPNASTEPAPQLASVPVEAHAANTATNKGSMRGRTAKPPTTKRAANERKSLSPHAEAMILHKCRRRCCVCFALQNDDSEKLGQIAHLDHQPSNNDPDNLAFLCMDHHAMYDARMLQAKNMSKQEVCKYRDNLHAAVQEGGVPSHSRSDTVDSTRRIDNVSATGNHNVVAGRDVHYTTINLPKHRGRKTPSPPPPPIIPGTVAEDPRMVGYLNYLVRRYEKFKRWECNITGTRMGYGLIRNRYREELHYEIIHTPKSMFERGVRYLQQRIENTRLGRMRKGQKLYDTFQEFDQDSSDKRGPPV